MTTLSIISPGLTYSDETLQLQKDLNALGYSITIDGLFGSETQGVVMSFQQSAGIEADGIAGPITLSAIQATLQGLSPEEWPSEARFIPQPEITMPGEIINEESILAGLAKVDWKWILLGMGIVMLITMRRK